MRLRPLLVVPAIVAVPTLLAGVGLVLGGAPAVASTGAPAAGSELSTGPQPVFVFAGRGHGHGVGLAQDSADAMAASGWSSERILEHFYPGTGRDSRQGPIRVMVFETAAATGAVTVSEPAGARVSDGSKSADAPAGSVLRVSYDGSYHVRSAPAAAAKTTRGEVLRSGLLALNLSPSNLLSASPSPSENPLPGLPTPAPSPAPPVGTPAPSPRPGRPSPSAPAPTRTRSPAASPKASPSRTSAPAAFGFDSASPLTITPAGGGLNQVVETGRSYRGQMFALARAGFRLVNIVDIEDYLRGLGEVPASWPDAALQSQAVAARTYAARAREAGHPLGYDVCDDTRCQVYLGAQAESARSTAATRSTAGEVMTYQGDLADAFYSANAGGLTANPTEGFGSAAAPPYLPAGVPAPGDQAAWTVSGAPTDVAARLGYPGRLDALTVTQRGPSGRALSLRLDGSVGARALSAIDAAGRLGLWSTLFQVRRGTGLAGALPPPQKVAGQLPPALAAAALPPVTVATTSDSPSPAPSVAAAPAASHVDTDLVLLALVLASAGALATALQLRDRRVRRRGSPLP